MLITVLSHSWPSCSSTMSSSCSTMSSSCSTAAALRFDNHFVQPCTHKAHAAEWYAAYAAVSRMVLDPVRQVRAHAYYAPQGWPSIRHAKCVHAQISMQRKCASNRSSPLPSPPAALTAPTVSLDPQVRVFLQPGDVLLVDNHRTLV